MVAFIWIARPKLPILRPFTEKFANTRSRVQESQGGAVSALFLIVTQSWPGACTQQVLNRDMDVYVSWISSKFYLVKIVLT